MDSNNKIARIAGLLYLILGICAGTSWSFVDSLYVPDNASATVNNILSSGWLFRLNFVSGLIGQIAFLFLVYYLYKLLRPVGKDAARLMVFLVAVSLPIAILNMLFLFAPILFFNGAYQSIFGAEQFNALVLFSLDLHSFGVFIAGIFWGLWMLPLGYLFFKSRYIPRIISIFLLIAGFGYIADSLLRFLLPGYDFNLASYTFMGELMLIFWLLIKGVKVQTIK